MAGPAAGNADWVCLGVITGAVGVRGEVRVKTFTDAPEAIGDYGKVTLSRSDRTLAVTVVRGIRGGVAARLEGVADRTAAEALKGEELRVPRAALPALEEESWYHADLIGLDALDEQGAKLGRVVAIYDFGAGDVLEIVLVGNDNPRNNNLGKVVMVPFTREVVPVLDVEGGYMTVRLPDDDGPGGVAKITGKA